MAVSEPKRLLDGRFTGRKPQIVQRSARPVGGPLHIRHGTRRFAYDIQVE
jgi:hypothetical protein